MNPWMIGVMRTLRAIYSCCLAGAVLALIPLQAPAAPMEVKSTAGGFSVMSPVRLEERVVANSIMLPGSDQRAATIQNHIFDGASGPLYFMVGYADYPESAFANGDAETVKSTILKGTATSITKRVNGTLLREATVDVEGIPATEIIVEVKDDDGTPIRVKGRYFMVGRRLYQIVVTADSGKGVAEMTDFLDSFHLLKRQ